MSHLKGLVKPVTPCVYTPSAEFFFDHFRWAPKMAGVVSPFLISSPCWDPREGRGYVAISDFIPLLGTPEKAGVM